MVTVVVPTRNSARTIEACLRSIRAQQGAEVEVIVVDNHSIDNTVALATGLVDRLETAGPERSAQRNRGAAVARGDYLLFVDSDMRLDPTVVSECLSIAAAGARGVIIPEDSIGTGFWANCRKLERSCYDGVDAVEAARFFTAPAFQEVGGYDIELMAAEDWDLSDRISVGKSLPRTKARIVHDEGRLEIWPHLRKKRYYGRSFKRYWQKPNSRKARSPIRSVYLRHWRRLLGHPVLTIGMLSLKCGETAALAVGMMEGPRR